MAIPDKPPPPLWIGIGIYFYAFIAIGIAEAGLGVMLPSVMVAYSLTPATVTLLFISQISGYVGAALTSSLVSSWIGLGRMLLTAASLLTLALLAYALSPTWAFMVTAGTLLGLGIGLIDAGVNTSMVQDPRSAHLIGALHGFYGIGALSGPAIATTLLALGLTFRHIYATLAGLVSLLIIGVLGALICRYPPLRKRTSAGQLPAWSNLKKALRTRRVVLFGVFLLVYVGIEASFSNWAYAVQVMARSTPSLIAGYSVSAYWIGLTVGRFLLGYLLHVLGAMKTITLCLILLLIGLVGWWLLHNPLISLPLIGLALGPFFPAIIWLIPKQLPGPLVPAAVSFATSAASVGAVLIPTGMGWIANWAGLGVIPVLMLPLALTMGGLHYVLVKSSYKAA
jgi:fucose permease